MTEFVSISATNKQSAATLFDEMVEAVVFKENAKSMDEMPMGGNMG